jgi:hypothetical protein
MNPNPKSLKRFLRITAPRASALFAVAVTCAMICLLVLAPFSPAATSNTPKSANSDLARAAVADAVAQANQMKDPALKSIALEKIVEVQIKAADFSGAQQTASVIPDSDRRAHAYAAIAFARASGPDANSAYALADAVTQGEATGLKLALAPEQQRIYRNGVLKAIASAQAARGDVAGVRATIAKAAPAQFSANEFLRLLGKAQVKAGDAAGAEKSFTDYLRSMPDAGVTADIQTQALALLCAAQIEAGDAASAQATAERVRNGATQATLLADIATAEAGPVAATDSQPAPASTDAAPAANSAGSLKDNPTAANKNVAKALELADAYRDLSGFDKSNALLKIAAAQAALSDFRGALQTAAKITDGFAKNQALTLIAVGQAKAGDVSGAQQTANSIVNDASAKNREDALAEVAIALAASGDMANAEKVENLLPMDYDVSAVTADLAVAQAQAGDVKSALITIDRLNQSDRRGWRFRIAAVNGIAKVQGRAGDANGARAWISSLGSPELEASALTGLAEGLTEGPVKKMSSSLRR